MSASTGDAVDHLEHFVSSLDPSTLAGQVASSVAATTAVTDVEISELAVSKALRESGIHSLLGIRLATGHLFRGRALHRDSRATRVHPERGPAPRGAEPDLDHPPRQRPAPLFASRKVDGIAVETELRERFVSVLMHDLTGPLAAATANAAKLFEVGAAADVTATATKIVADLGMLPDGRLASEFWSLPL